VSVCVLLANECAGSPSAVVAQEKKGIGAAALLDLSRTPVGALFEARQLTKSNGLLLPGFHSADMVRMEMRNYNPVDFIPGNAKLAHIGCEGRGGQFARIVADIEQYRDRGILKVQLRRFNAAVRDFEQYVKGAPHSKDRPQVEEHLKELRRIQAMMN
jgi:hypothetical protein